MGETIDTFAEFLLIGGGVALIVCGFVIAKPNLHGLQFVEGTCGIVSASQKSFYDDLPTCACSGKNCREEYPCISVEVEFTSANSTGVTFTGALHHDYAAVKEECLVESDPCSSSFEENVETVFGYYRDFIFPLLGEEELVYPAFDGYNDLIDMFGDKEKDYKEEIIYNNTVTFDCWGHEKDELVYIEHNYSKLKVILSLAVPGGACLLGILLSLSLGSESLHSEVLTILGLPFIFIFGIFAAIWDCFRECCPDCTRRPTPRRVEQDVEMVVATSPSSTRRRSWTIEAENESFGGMSLEAGPSVLRLAERHDHGPTKVDPSPWSGLSAHFAAAAPPSYTTYDSGHVNPPPSRSPYLGYNSSSLPTGPIISPGYTDTSDMPPPPSYDDVVL